jgi:hypothetical protein
MNKHTIQQKLANSRLTQHERETLLQYLHYLTAEGITGVAASPSRAKPPAQKSKRNYNAGKAKPTSPKT